MEMERWEGTRKVVNRRNGKRARWRWHKKDENNKGEEDDIEMHVLLT